MLITPRSSAAQTKSLVTQTTAIAVNALFSLNFSFRLRTTTISQENTKATNYTSSSHHFTKDNQTQHQDEVIQDERSHSALGLTLSLLRFMCL